MIERVTSRTTNKNNNKRTLESKRSATEKRSFEVVSPIKAKLWLATNSSTNRQLRSSKVKPILNSINNGTFDAKKSVSDIEFENGKLVNGQHRLTAIVRSGKTVKLYVKRS